MLTIDAINTMIGYLGETPIDPNDPDYTLHPLYDSALRILTNTSRTVQSRGWWFNTVRKTLTPVAGALALAGSVLTVRVLNSWNTEYAIRAGAMYDMTNDTATINVPLDAVVVSLVDFEDLPETAAAYIQYKAAEKFVKTYDGDPLKLRSVADDSTEAYTLFNADHIRNAKVNLFQTASTGAVLSNVWYHRYLPR